MSNERKLISTWVICVVALVCFVLCILAMRHEAGFSEMSYDGPLDEIAFFGSLACLVWLLVRLPRLPFSRMEWLVTVALTSAYGIVCGFYCAVRFTAEAVFLGNASYALLQKIPFIAVLAMEAFAMLFILLEVLLFALAGWFGYLGSSRMRHAVALSLIGILVGMVTHLGNDDSPQPAPFSMSQLPVPKRDAEESHRLMLTYYQGGPDTVTATNLPLWTKRDYMTNATAYAVEMETIWAGLKDARQLMAKLDSFDGIADLSEPIRDQPTISYVAYRNMAQIYWAYSILKCQEGKPMEAAQHLAQLHSVIRKGLPYSRSLLRQMIWIAILKGNADVAHILMNDSHFDSDSVATLKSAFAPIPAEDLSLRGPIIFESISVRNRCADAELAEICGSYRIVNAVSSPTTLVWRVSCWLAPVVYNPVRTTHKLDQHFQSIVDAASAISPAIMDKLFVTLFNESTKAAHTVKNPLGSILVSTPIPSYGKAFATATRAKIGSDLLALEISQRLGESLTLNDPWTGEPYRLDPATGAFSSSGPDKLPDTKDDIRLPLDKWP